MATIPSYNMRGRSVTVLYVQSLKQINSHLQSILLRLHHVYRPTEDIQQTHPVKNVYIIKSSVWHHQKKPLRLQRSVSWLMYTAYEILFSERKTITSALSALRRTLPMNLLRKIIPLRCATLYLTSATFLSRTGSILRKSRDTEKRTVTNMHTVTIPVESHRTRGTF